MPSGVKIRKSTIAWTTRGGAKWTKMKPKLPSTTVAEAAAPAKVHFYARDARVSGRYWFKDVNITGVRALISGKKLTISFDDPVGRPSCGPEVCRRPVRLR